jgi:heme exporter protein A
MAPQVEVQALTKAYGLRRVLGGVSLTVAAGQSVALLGPNGAGKTTLLRILASLSRPTSGRVLVGGADLARAADSLRRRVGYLSHRTLLYDDLTAEQNLAFYARAYGLAGPAARIDALLARVGLEARRHDLVRTFSRGMQQRLALARAILHEPDLLLLDEPDSGLDPSARQALAGLVREVAGGEATTVLTTHDLDTAFALSERIVVLARGRLVADVATAQTDRQAFAAAYLQWTAQA